MAERRATWDAVALLDDLLASRRRSRPRKVQAVPAQSLRTGPGVPVPPEFAFSSGAGPVPGSWPAGVWAQMLRPLVLWPFAALPPLHYVAAGGPENVDNPAGPLLHPAAAVPAFGLEQDVYPMPARFHRVAVVDLGKPIPATPAGTHALAAGVVVADLTADALDDAAHDAGVGTARKWRAEAAAYRDYATAANARVAGSVDSWASDLAATRPAASGPAPVAATAYGTAVAGPTDPRRRNGALWKE